VNRLHLHPSFAGWLDELRERIQEDMEIAADFGAIADGTLEQVPEPDHGF
jgi:hypothetical protein